MPGTERMVLKSHCGMVSSLALVLRPRVLPMLRPWRSPRESCCDVGRPRPEVLAPSHAGCVLLLMAVTARLLVAQPWSCACACSRPHHCCCDAGAAAAALPASSARSRPAARADIESPGAR